MNSRRIVSLGLLTVAMAALNGSSLAADPPKPADSQPDEIVVIPLKHADANRLAPTIQHIARCSAVAIPHINSIVISVQKERLAEIRGLIEKLDVAPQKAASQEQLRVYSLKSIPPDKNLEKSLGVVLAGRQNARFAIDPARNQVIVYCDEQTVDMVTALLAKLDSPPDKQPTYDMQVRIIWLVNGAVADKAPKMPEDVGPLLPTLARMGIDKPVLAAQTIVTVASDTSFVAKGAAAMDGTSPCDFSVSGMASEHKSGSRLSLNIHAIQGKQEVSRLETEIAAPLGHIVVLGMTPTANLTSVFLVQVQRVEPAASKK